MKASTTEILIEIFVTGFTAFIWICMIIFSVTGFNAAGQSIPVGLLITENMDQLVKWIPVIILALAAFAYLAGWLIDHLSYYLFYKYCGIGKFHKRKYINNTRFFKVYTTVCENVKEKSGKQLDTDMSLIRFTRSGCLNFLMILAVSIILKIGFGYWYLIQVISGILAVICLYVLLTRWEYWYLRIFTIYNYYMEHNGGNKLTENIVNLSNKHIIISLAIVLGLFIILIFPFFSIIIRFTPLVVIFALLSVFAIIYKKYKSECWKRKIEHSLKHFTDALKQYNWKKAISFVKTPGWFIRDNPIKSTNKAVEIVKEDLQQYLEKCIKYKTYQKLITVNDQPNKKGEYTVYIQSKTGNSSITFYLEEKKCGFYLKGILYKNKKSTI